jgi:endonuclease YncB( thermonuclease family)
MSNFLPNICQAEITRVIDGDTYVAEYNSKPYIIRIIGCDCFETRYSAKLRTQAQRHGLPLVTALQKGRGARNFAENVLLNTTVTLTRPEGSPDNDQFFRALRKVEFLWNNVPTDVATLLTQRGHAA